MNKGLGRKQQVRGQRRSRKNAERKMRKLENLAYVSRLMFKYGKDLNLTQRPGVGEKYLKDILGV